jgi:hypothetical protein
VHSEPGGPRSGSAVSSSSSQGDCSTPSGIPGSPIEGAPQEAIVVRPWAPGSSPLAPAGLRAQAGLCLLTMRTWLAPDFGSMNLTKPRGSSSEHDILKPRGSSSEHDILKLHGSLSAPEARFSGRPSGFDPPDIARTGPAGMMPPPCR